MSLCHKALFAGSEGGSVHLHCVAGRFRRRHPFGGPWGEGLVVHTERYCTIAKRLQTRTASVSYQSIGLMIHAAV
jgi:hypothetical protein